MIGLMPCLFDGPINSESFHAYVEQFLVPTLKPSDIVFLDNLGSHKGKAAESDPRRRGAPGVPPQILSDLNPIEQVFASSTFDPFSDRLGRGVELPRRGSRRGGGWHWVGVVSGLFNRNDSGVGALERRPRHEEGYHEGGGCGRRSFAFG